jgi:hypothetical protein
MTLEVVFTIGHTYLPLVTKIKARRFGSGYHVETFTTSGQFIAEAETSPDMDLDYCKRVARAQFDHWSNVLNEAFEAGKNADA